MSQGRAAYAVTAFALLGAACGGGTPDRSTASTTVTTADLIPWVVAEADAKTVTVYVGLRMMADPAPKPVGLAGDDALSVTFAGEKVPMTTFANYSGYAFRQSTMLRDFSSKLADDVYYAASTTVKSTGPLEISVDLTRATVRGGPVNVAHLVLEGSIGVSGQQATTATTHGKLDVCWAPQDANAKAPGPFENDLGVFGICTTGTTIFTASSGSLLAGCGSVDFNKVALDDPHGCDVTVYARYAAKGEYGQALHPSPHITGEIPESDAPEGYVFTAFTAHLAP